MSKISNPNSDTHYLSFNHSECDPKEITNMKIIYFGQKHTLSREGGIEVVVYELATRIAAKGHDVTCYDRKGRHVAGAELDNRREFKGVKIEPVWTIEKRGLAAVTSSFAAAVKSAFSDADVVHIHAEGPAAMCWIPHLFHKRVVIHVHGLDWRRDKWEGKAAKYIKWGERQAVKYADEIIVLSHSVQEYFKTTYGREVVFIPNGVNKPTIREADEIKSKWGLEKNSYVLFLGRIVPEKGLRYLIEAWKGVKTDKRLVIAGGSSDTDDFMKELKGVAGENVIFTGFQQGRILEELYSNCYIYVLPTDLEGMPLSLLEALSYGNCCVVSNIPECTEVIGDKAVIFKKSNVDDLRQKLQELLNDSIVVEHYKLEASDFICSKYNWDDVVRRILGVYKG